MTGRDDKHCGRLTDHDPHPWEGTGQTTVVTSEPDTWMATNVFIGPNYWCKGHIVVEGGHW